jgi:hypothetical protein
MKIILVTVMTPAPENIRGTSALPYHLMIERDKSIEIEAYSFNLNNLNPQQIRQAEDDLNITIHLLDKPRWFRWVFKFHLLFIRLFLGYPLHNYIKLPHRVLKEICEKSPDGVWIYGEELSRVSRQLSQFNRIHTLPDCESLYYYRLLGKRFVMRDTARFWRAVFMYPKFLRMEWHFDASPSVHYHLVGAEDINFLQEVCPGIQGHFIHHPHYETQVPAKKIAFSSPKIKLLIAGQYNLYMKQDADLLIHDLVSDSDRSILASHYSITFLGKGWDVHVASLKQAGYEVNHIRFAPNYIEEICNYDIQITPITIGTGTKGKVLDALANGLLVIGSWYALENIAVEHGRSCLMYNSVSDVITFLKDIPSNIRKYEGLAEEGRASVLLHHQRREVSSKMFANIPDVGDAIN